MNSSSIKKSVPLKHVLALAVTTPPEVNFQVSITEVIAALEAIVSTANLRASNLGAFVSTMISPALHEQFPWLTGLVPPSRQEEVAKFIADLEGQHGVTLNVTPINLPVSDWY